MSEKLYIPDGDLIVESDIELFDHSLQAFGIKKQWDCVIEESAELIVAIKHFERKRILIDEVIEELVDVELQIKLLEYHLNCPMIFSNMREAKRIKHAQAIAQEYRKKLRK